MPHPNASLFCSEACRNEPLVRSFGTCPGCGQRWNGRNDGTDRHYRNNAWKLCDSCGIEQQRCVVCGSSIRTSSGDVGIESDVAASHDAIRHGGLHD